MEHIQGDCSVSKEEFEKHLAEYIGNTKLTEVPEKIFMIIQKKTGRNILNNRSNRKIKLLFRI
ncbi:hypothetical protein DWX80_10450 [Ruminococcus sp. AF21-3]|nr:hypothetical protein DWX80_10450 [Ruminococcus sp. AF21-3]